jgi:ferredoxin
MTTPIVYIEPGCIYCQACTTTAPEVFILQDDPAMIKGDVRIDGITSQNIHERSPLIAEVDWDLIQEAAAGCPIEIIKIV